MVVELVEQFLIMEQQEVLQVALVYHLLEVVMVVNQDQEVHLEIQEALVEPVALVEVVVAVPMEVVLLEQEIHLL
tara:strand:- start:350 stop:574 length:225 start_codon:yes stop_codon:yes gene_type:complete